jgi:hypothetical protein
MTTTTPKPLLRLDGEPATTIVRHRRGRPLYDMGEHDGRQYVSDGETLFEIYYSIDGNPVPQGTPGARTVLVRENFPWLSLGIPVPGEVVREWRKTDTES